jgi:hypothetical protein
MMLSDYLFRMKTGPEIDEELRVRISDKEHVKEFVRERLGDQFNVPTTAVLRSYEEAKRFDYPNRCVIKPTHASMQIILRKKGEPIDFDKIDFWFDYNFYYQGSRERNYKSLVPKVIVEPFVFDRDDVDDYKIFCWRGEPKFTQVIVGGFRRCQRACFDTDWKLLPFTMRYPQTRMAIPRPSCLSEMYRLARRLSSPFSFIRVDLYVEGEQIRVGELTNCPEAGNLVFFGENAERIASETLFGADFVAAAPVCGSQKPTPSRPDLHLSASRM